MITRIASMVVPPAAVLATFVAINMISARWSYRIDLTSSGVYSLSSESLEIAKSVADPVQIIFFSNEQSQELRDASTLLQQLAKASPNISLTISDPNLEPSLARKHRVRFAGTTVYLSENRRVVTHGGTETEFVNGLIRIGQDGGQNVCFSDGHAESDPFSNESHDHQEGAGSHSHSSGGKPLIVHEGHGMGAARRALETLGYLVEKRNLLNGNVSLEGCDILIVASPKVSFLDEEVLIIRDFLNDGRGVIFLSEPGVASGLSDLISDYRLNVTLEAVSDPELHYGTDSWTPAVSNYPEHEITRNLPLSFFPGVSAINILEEIDSDSIVVFPVANSSSGAVLGESQEEDEKILAAYAIKQDGEIKRRLLVFGDGDFATNSYFHVLGNGALFLNSVNSILQRTSLHSISPRYYEESRVALTNQQMFMTFAVSTVVLPCLLSLLGLGFWWRGR